MNELPQIFITKVLADDNLPDVEILTLPIYKTWDSMKNLSDLERTIFSREIEGFQPIGGSSIYEGQDSCLASLHQAIIDASVREEMPWNPEATRIYAETIFSDHPIPLMNSPIKGSSLKDIIAAVGSASAFMVALPDPSLGQITLYFVMIGGVKIILGAADGISIGLKQGLSQVIMKWMGVPKSISNSKKKKKRKNR